MALIILEGPDCCFKSTVAAKLSKELSIQLSKAQALSWPQAGMRNYLSTSTN